MGWLPAAVLAQIVARACAGEEPLASVIERSVHEVAEQYASFPESTVLTNMVMHAIELSREPHGTPEADRARIHELGEGWVGEEALCVAIYAALAYEENFATAIRCAVNHWGDSDSTGAICGNILGAYQGFAAVRAEFDLLKLEQIDVLLKVADDMLALGDDQ
jgi:ADP-ribosylglycohydrolase